MFGRWVFAAIIKYVNIHAAYFVGSVHARSLTRANICLPDGFCVMPDTIACAKVSGQYCMADIIAFDTGNISPHPS